MECKTLETLDLHFNGIDGHGAQILVDLLSQEESSIRFLNISQNPLYQGKLSGNTNSPLFKKKTICNNKITKSMKSCFVN